MDEAEFLEGLSDVVRLCVEAGRDAQEKEVQRLREALATILANTEAEAIPHIAYDGMTAYEALAKDIADCARAALKIAKD